ncbi:hypothetical protein CEP51_002221 [Fusarium floridanum]|uniref:Uncharacterized protein n=1 Tax=Fusarium floridanum TaxID=1325733 RepID=A0A428SCH9_9HYPO|nr:hypothetical protein CEP51_002221 [Fusarium floridanum]
MSSHVDFCEPAGLAVTDIGHGGNHSQRVEKALLESGVADEMENDKDDEDDEKDPTPNESDHGNPQYQLFIFEKKLHTKPLVWMTRNPTIETECHSPTMRACYKHENSRPFAKKRLSTLLESQKGDAILVPQEVLW